MKERKTMKLLAIGLAAWSVASCRSPRTLIQTEETAEKTMETVNVGDTTVNVKLVPYYTEKEIMADSSRLTNPYGWSFARWDGKTIHHELGIWPNAGIDVKMPLWKKTVEKTTDRVVEKPVEKIVEVEKKLTLWQTIKQKTGGASLVANGIILLLLALYLKKKSG